MTDTQANTPEITPDTAEGFIKLYAKNFPNIWGTKLARAYLKLHEEKQTIKKVFERPVMLAHAYVEKYQPEHITCGDSLIEGVIKDAECLRAENKYLSDLLITLTQNMESMQQTNEAIGKKLKGLDGGSQRLRAALEMIVAHQHSNPGNTGELKIIACEALKEQP